MQMTKKFQLRRRRFQENTDGAVTVEAAIWLPFFIFFLFGIAEMALVFHGQARALQVAQDANRAYTIGEFATAAETATWAKASLAGFSNDVKALTWEQAGIITTAISIPAADLAGNIGIFSMLSDLDITVVSQQVREF
jgi:Flp pilus assembly protein TadG